MSTFGTRLARLERPRAQSAGWCQTLALFGGVLLAVAIFAHRAGTIDTVPTFWVLGVIVLVLLAALVTGARALYELWAYGYKGGLKAARGMALAAVLLLPFAYHAALAVALPPLHDVSTDLDEPPAFDTALDDRVAAMNPVADPTPMQANAQLRAYPRLAARRYPLGQGRVFREVVALFADRDWIILTSQSQQGAAPIDDEGSGLVARRRVDGEGRPLSPTVPRTRPDLVPETRAPETPVPAFEPQQISPVGREDGSAVNGVGDERYVEAVAQSFVFGFESDVVVRMVEVEDGTLVDMRSTSRWGPHDLGENASRIESFMNDLDVALQGAGQGG